MKRLALDDPRFNRHVQWLEFNRRVLEEVRDIGNPLLERVRPSPPTIWMSSLDSRAPIRSATTPFETFRDEIHVSPRTPSAFQSETSEKKTDGQSTELVLIVLK